MPPLSLSDKDINAFADLGTQVATEGNELTVTRNGKRFTVAKNGLGYTVTTSDGGEKTFPNAGALLADAAFADLPRIAKNQVVLLSPQRVSDNPVPIVGELKNIVGDSSIFAIEQGQTPWLALDQWLAKQQGSSTRGGTDLLLIDGPAGVGKTTVVREAALLRAERYDGSAPLILQIASRGRVLQNIADLIAFALQDVRSNLTIGQLMSLVRHGLIILAIDGFDELSDPNGFETAWSGLNNLIASSRGAATFLLAGRETFVSTELMQRQITSFDTRTDRLSSLTLGDPDPAGAKNWLLAQQGWDQELLDREFVEPIFEHGSYALRPFFLDVISREPTALASDEPPASDLLSYLVQVMLRREAEKFTEALDPLMESNPLKTTKPMSGDSWKRLRAIWPKTSQRQSPTMPLTYSPLLQPMAFYQMIKWPPLLSVHAQWYSSPTTSMQVTFVSPMNNFCSTSWRAKPCDRWATAKRHAMCGEIFSGAMHWKCSPM